MKNLDDLRAQLVGVFYELRSGAIKPDEAFELSNLAGKMIASAKVQVEYYALRKEKPDIAFLNSNPNGALSPIPALNQPPIVQQISAEKLDVVEYLQGKGVKISRIAGGAFMVNGEKVSGPHTLELVNSHRKRGDLPELKMHEVK